MHFIRFKFIGVFIALAFAIPTFAQDKDTLYIGNENLKFQFNADAIALANETPCDLIELELQTYPTASTSLSRIAGTGSYYYKIARLERSKRTMVAWKQFTNKEGVYLDMSKYSFNRISVHAKKCPGKDEKRFGGHYGLTF